MILLIDNYDSFSYNVYQLIGSVEPDIRVIRNDDLTVEEIEQLQQDNLDAEKRIGDSLNLHEVQKKAIALGMAYPSEENVIFYTVDAEEYMCQTDDIPQ